MSCLLREAQEELDALDANQGQAQESLVAGREELESSKAKLEHLAHEEKMLKDKEDKLSRRSKQLMVRWVYGIDSLSFMCVPLTAFFGSHVGSR